MSYVAEPFHSLLLSQVNKRVLSPHDELFLKVAKILKYPNGNIDEKVPTAKEAKNFFKKMVKKQEEKK